MPVARWMTQDLRELVEHNFSETTLKNQGLFKHQFIKKLFDDHLEHRRDNRKPLWTLLVFQLWYAKYMA
jgi:asparagine synthase (glutamine-hydrolysing)